MLNIRKLLSAGLVLTCLSTVAYAEKPVKEPAKALKLYDGKMSIDVKKDGEVVKITRRKTPEALIGGVLQPIVPVKGVHPVGEVEVLKALQDPSFKVVDMRTEDWRVKATIPGSAHIPYTEVAKRLDELGCVKAADKWDCSKAVKVVGFCNGANCPQSPIAIKAMVREGFPADHIYYYRGGMNSWIVMGLTVAEGEF